MSIAELQFDLYRLTKEYNDCKFFIENGNWVGYSENLSIRKQRLKEYQFEIEQLLKSISNLQTINQLEINF